MTQARQFHSAVTGRPCRTNATSGGAFERDIRCKVVGVVTCEISAVLEVRGSLQPSTRVARAPPPDLKASAAVRRGHLWIHAAVRRRRRRDVREARQSKDLDAIIGQRQRGSAPSRRDECECVPVRCTPRP